MKHYRFFILFLLSFLVITLAIPFCFAADQDYSSIDTLTSDFTLGSTIQVQKTATDSIVKKISAEVSFYPRNDPRQQGSFLVLEPNAININDDVKFQWDNPAPESLSFKLVNRVKTQNEFVKVKTKVAFPYATVPDDAQKYLASSELMDFDTHPEIKTKASELAQGEDDAFVVAYNIASFVGKDVNYSLNSLTAEASLPASWVLKNREGVCDEITNLFISMVRSVGIPARFVVGMSYTNSDLFSENWGAHGWAEVYFPQYGWVPFDVTYNQLGYVDATHIKLKEAADSSKTGTKYEWEGRDINLNVKKLDLEVKVLSVGKKIDDRVALTTELLYPEVGFGSYNVLKVTVKNINNYYVSTQLYLSKTDNLNLLDADPRNILLKPYEEKVLYYKVKTYEKLNNNYVYTFFITAYTQMNENASTSFTTSLQDDVYTFKQVDDYILKNTQSADEKTYTQKIQLACLPDKQQYLLSDEKKVKCVLSNKGNTVENNIYVCLKDDCQRINSKIGDEQELFFALPHAQLGENEYVIKATNSVISIQDIVNIQVVDIPKIVIVQKNFQAEQLLSDPVTLSLTLNKDSLAIPKDVGVVVSYEKLTKDWHFDSVDNQLTFTLQLQPYELRNKENTFTITITYKDDAGKSYLLQDTVVIKLKELGFKDTLILYSNQLLYDPVKLYTVLFILLLIVVLLLLFLFFKKRKGAVASQKVEANTVVQKVEKKKK